MKKYLKYLWFVIGVLFLIGFRVELPDFKIVHWTNLLLAIVCFYFSYKNTK